ncbi:hypothetical protein ABZ682_22970 [Streptomyces griseoviridis]|uniref:hypothetical protein n=1 Tax=Streptomyces griseoviridis TaxID=45398 RepID=UPI0033C08B05
MSGKMIDTRVTIDGTFGPFDCRLDPRLCYTKPWFPLAETRKVAARTQYLAYKHGNSSTETIHVIEGRTDGPDSVHLIEGVPGRNGTPAVAVRIRWKGARPTATLGEATADARREVTRKATARRKAARSGRTGAPRAVVVHIDWCGLGEDFDEAAFVVEPSADGLYPVGAPEWRWDFASWWCPACQDSQPWHEVTCPCGLSRPATPLGAAGWNAGCALHCLTPEATSVLVDLDGSARIVDVHAGDTRIDMDRHAEPFGQAEEILRTALAEAKPGELAATGWERAPGRLWGRRYQITFPASRP